MGDLEDRRRPTIAEFGIIVDDLDKTQIDAHPFGVIQLDTSGKILAYNTYEEQLAGLRREDVIGKHFFFEVAPCTKVRAFYGRFLDGVALKALNATFGFVFPLPQGPRQVEITMWYRERDETIWLLVRG